MATNGTRRADLARRIWINAAIVGCLVMAVILFVSTIWHTPWSGDTAWRHIMTVNHFFRRLLGLLLVLVTWYLFKRRFVAWLVAVIALSAGFALYLPHRDTLMLTIGALHLFCLVTLAASHRHFCRGADRPSLRRGLTIFLAMMVFIVLDAVIGRLLAHPHLTWMDSLTRVGNTLFVTGGQRPATWFAVVVFWTCFVIGVLLVLRPVIFQAVMTPRLKARARALVQAHGDNPLSYLALENDKLLFFSQAAPGVVAYTITGDFVIALGDPICAKDDIGVVLREFDEFCAASDYTIAFLGSDGTFLDQYAALGYDRIKAGEEACFDLTGFTLAGGARAKMRSKVNGATHSGVTVEEYRPLEGRDTAIERAIEQVSAEWLQQKKSGELTFVVGGVNLGDPADRRYFIARDAGGQIVGFNVFLPYAGGKGYLVDVTRRRIGAPPGVTEKITAEAFARFKEEGCLYASLGGAPLAHLGEDDNQHPVADRALGLVYEKGNRFYGFKALRRAKNKYGPTWRPTYWVYPRGALTPRMVMAVIKAQNPGGFRDFLTGFTRQLLPARSPHPDATGATA